MRGIRSSTDCGFFLVTGFDGMEALLLICDKRTGNQSSAFAHFKHIKIIIGVQPI